MSVLNIKRVTTAFALMASIAATGCSEKSPSAKKVTGPAATAAQNDPRAKVLGVEAGPPAMDTPGTTSPARSDVSAAQESKSMPLPGQANDHSTLSPKPSQKAAPTGR